MFLKVYLVHFCVNLEVNQCLNAVSFLAWSPCLHRIRVIPVGFPQQWESWLPV